MIGLDDIQQMLSETFFDGNSDIVAIILYIVMVGGVLSISRNVFFALLVGMVATLMFSLIGILSTEVTVLMIIISTLGLAYTSRRIWGD